MDDNQGKPSVLLVDDRKDLLDSLKYELGNFLNESEVFIDTWWPNSSEGENTKEVFYSKLNDHTVLVVTDYDLTLGAKGLFGHTIVGWCQNKAIPVGDFSRGNTSELPKEPNAFELRVPVDGKEGAKFIANTFFGFEDIRLSLQANPELLGKSASPAILLSKLLGRPYLDNTLALYFNQFGSGNSSLAERLSHFTKSDMERLRDNKIRAMTYVLGHILLNGILKFPGPILSERALCAYISTSEEETASLASLFAPARYDGPFGKLTHYYWRDDVGEVLQGFNEHHKDALVAEKFDDIADLNRAICEAELKRDLKSHECPRCGGKKGGFLCPFTAKTVCLRPDCSVGASSWVPQGADLSRIEREFYDEWEPFLGI